jgi:hypothetical protein
MSDFGAWACDFHGDFASDFRAESNDFASDFRAESNDFASDVRDFPGDFAGDFGGATRTAKQPPETPETAPPEQAAPRQGNRGTRTAASWQRKRQATEQRTTPRNKAINNGHRASGTEAV